MRHLKYTFCTFAALWIPINLFAAFLGIESFSRLVSPLGELPLYLTLIGCILLLIDLWQSKKTQDQKIWWTVLGLMFFPVVVPAYWFGYGIKNLNNSAEPDTRGNSRPKGRSCHS